MITILILSYNRPDYLGRAIKYWSRSDYSVIIADGSDSPLHYEFPSNINYLHCPSASIVDRLNILAKKVTTPYVVLSADDDFFAFEGLALVAEFLDEHPDYSAAQGFYTRFQFPDSDSKIHWVWEYQHASNYKFDHGSGISRFASAMRPPIMHYCYSVMRPEAFNSSLALLRGADEMLLTAMELCFIPGVMAQGKFATLPVFYGARQAQLRRWGNHVHFDEWVEQNSPLGYAMWRKNICDLFSCEPDISKDRIGQLVDSTIGAYAAWVKKKRLNKDAATKPKKSLRRSASAILGRSGKSLQGAHRFLRRTFNLYQMFGMDCKRLGAFNRDWLKMKSIILANPIDDSLR